MFTSTHAGLAPAGRNVSAPNGFTWPMLALAVVAPFAIFVVLKSFPALDISLGSLTMHFYVVTAVALLALLLAVAVGVAARRLPDARTFFLAGGFTVMALIFFAHGLGTSPWFAPSGTGGDNPFADYATGGAKASTATSPGSEGQPNAIPGLDRPGLEALLPGITSEPVTTSTPPSTGHAGHVSASDGSHTASSRARLVGFSSSFSLVAAAPLFALSVIELRDKFANRIARYWNALFLAICLPALVYLVIAIVAPTWLDWVPFPSKPLIYSIAVLACACYAFAAWRNLQAYRMAMLPLQGTMALSMVMLIESQVFLLGGELGQLSWWEYHVVMLVGFFTASAALLWQFRATGDLGIVVEGLFLSERISGIRHNDPSAMPALVAAVSAKDNETAGHIERVSELSVAIGRQLGLQEERLRLLRLAGRLHDVGKIGVPNAILRKPDKLTTAEYEEIKYHPVRGWLIALRSGALSEVAPIIRAHHERMDGRGYPDGLSGNEIPLEARIVSVADFWDALTGPRPYRAPLPPKEAAALAKEAAGSHLDPRCVQALFTVTGRENQDRPAQAETESRPISKAS